MNKILILILFTIIFNCNNVFSQKIDLIKENGVYKINCKINDIPLKFVFDTGANSVVISGVEAMFLLKNELLEVSDIISKEDYIDASGKIGSSTKIIIRKLQIGNIILTDINASVIEGNNVPLLLGLSAIEKLGQILINFEESKIIIL